MTRTIKAQDVKPGMEIEYEHGGWTFSVVVGGCEESHGDVWVFSVAGVGRFLENGQEVTVLKEAQPPEPTAFGARVVVDGRRFLRAPESKVDSQSWLEENEGKWRFWDDLLRMGPVMVIPDQGWTDLASTEQREPRVWDQWADVPRLIPVPVRVSGIETLYRKVGDRIECKRGGSWEPAFADEHDLNRYSPFTEVLPGA